MTRTINFSDTNPAPGDGFVNVGWNAEAPTIEPRDVAAYVRNLGSANYQSGASYTIDDSDQGKVVNLTFAGAKAITLPNTLSNKFVCALVNISAGTSTLTPSTGNVNAVASIDVEEGSGAVLFFDGTNWAAVVGGGGGGGSTARDSVAIVTGTLANNAVETGTVAIGKSFDVIRSVCSHKARVRLYSTAAFRTTDASRAFGSPVPNNSGLIIDCLQNETGLLDLVLSPNGDGKNMDTVPVDTIYYSIQNVHGSSQVITATIHFIPKEA